MLYLQVIEHSHAELMKLTQDLQTESDATKKAALYQFFFATRTRLLKLLALLKWSPEQGDLDRCVAMRRHCDERNATLSDVRYFLHASHGALQSFKDPSYDVHTAFAVLGNRQGASVHLPLHIQYPQTIPPDVLVGMSTAEARTRLEDELRLQLLCLHVPPQFSSVTIDGGKLICTVADEFELSLVLEVWQT